MTISLDDDIHLVRMSKPTTIATDETQIHTDDITCFLRETIRACLRLMGG